MNIKQLFNIVEKRKILFIISIAVIVIGIIGLFIRGFNWDIDFIGGTTQHYNIQKVLSNDDIAKIDNIIEDVTGEKASSIQITGNDKKEVLIKTKELSSENRDKVFEKLKDEFKISAQDRYSVDNVSATVGRDMTNSAILSMVVASILMLVYITIRFSFRSGLAAVIALLHDIAIMLTMYIILGIPVGSTMIAAVLTILGYSINATIIIFDRVRENKKLMPKEAFGDVVNKSIWQTMARCINTSATVAVVLILLSVMGVNSVRDFSIPILIGVIAGTYSSVFISGNIWYLLENKKRQLGNPKKKPA